jgi:NADH-quinone oxidoreductase subunit L
METLRIIFPAGNCALLCVIVLLPLLGAIVNGVFGKRLGKEAVSLMALSAIGASFLASTAAFFMLKAAQTGDEAAHLMWTGWQWMSLSTAGELNALNQGGSIQRINIDLGFSMDALSGSMALIVTGVGFLIHLYSTKYMEDDPSFHRFFAYLNLFIFSMLVLILGNSLPVLFVGWEGVGLCSYLLIGFWFSDQANAAAGKKAFITNRIGDFGLLVAMALLVRYTGSLSWSGIASGAQDLLRPMTVWQVPVLQPLVPHTPGLSQNVMQFIAGPHQVSVATLVGLSAFLGCAGKSAQIPLYVWLPDAMAGPTPVSALIHAATMVTAGVYLVCRMAPVFVLSPAAMFTIALVGAATALLAATIAFAQNDIKKVLAYSTVSQLGYMFLGVGVGAFTAGFFHVITHAFFKACLFLGAGSVIHAMHARIHDNNASQDIRNMGGLREWMPTTHWTFLASCIAIAGIPPTSGFFSKDEILHNALTSGIKPPMPDGTMMSSLGPIELFKWPTWGGPVLFGMGAIGAVMTAFYMFRLYILTFQGSFRGWKVVTGWKAPEHAHGHDHHGHDHHEAGERLEGPTPHESPPQMTYPLVVLAVLALGAGIIWGNNPLGKEHGLFEHFLEPLYSRLKESIQITERGGHTAMAVGLVAAVGGTLGGLYVYFQQGGAPAKRFVEQFPKLHQLAVEKWRVDELYDELVIGTVDFIADMMVLVDKWVVDGIVARLTSWVVAVSGHALRLLQTGRVQAYAAFMMVGTACMGWFFTVPQAKAHVVNDETTGRYTVSVAPGLGYAFRWDADSDGKPDTADFGDKTSVELTLGVGESKAVRFEVKNAFGRVKQSSVTVSRPKPSESPSKAAEGDRPSDVREVRR